MKSNILKLSGFKNLIIALHRPTNLKDMLMSNTFVDYIPETIPTAQNPTNNIGPVQQNIGRFSPTPNEDSDDENLCPAVTSLLDLYENRRINGRTQATSLLDLYAAHKNW